MRKMTKMFGLFALASLMVGSLFAADSKPVVSFSGLVDTYLSMNITNMSNDNTGGGNGGFYGFATKDSSYTLGLAEMTTKVTAGDASLNLTLATGEVAESLSSLTLPYAFQWGDINVMSANITLTKDIWTFTFGKFMTWVGNEVVESSANMNYSRSILFYGIPLYHVGFSVGVAPDSVFGATLFVVNGWNSIEAYPTNGGNSNAANNPFAGEKSFGLQVKVVPPDSNLTAIFNCVYGPDYYGTPDLPTAVGELILSLAANDQLTLALDTQMAMQTPPVGSAASYIGAALYGKLTLEQGWGLALRLEEVIDNGTDLIGGGVVDGPSAEYREATLTIENKMTDNFLARLEGRYDWDLYDGQDTADYAAGDGKQITVTASTVFSF